MWLLTTVTYIGAISITLFMALLRIAIVVMDQIKPLLKFIIV